jgi:hypothetical protein
MKNVLYYKSDNLDSRFKIAKRAHNMKIYFLSALSICLMACTIFFFIMVESTFLGTGASLLFYAAFTCCFGSCLFVSIQPWLSTMGGENYVETKDGGYVVKGKNLSRIYAVGKSFQLPDLSLDETVKVYADPKCVFIQSKTSKYADAGIAGLNATPELFKFECVRWNRNSLVLNQDSLCDVDSIEAPHLKELQIINHKKYTSQKFCQDILQFLPQLEVCEGLNSIDLPWVLMTGVLKLNHLKEIEDAAFQGAFDLTVHAPKAALIGSHAFGDTNGLSLCADTVKNIDGAFLGCKNAKISLNGLVKFHERHAFDSAEVLSLELSSLELSDYTHIIDHELHSSSIRWPTRLAAIKLKRLEIISQDTISQWRNYGESFIIFAYDTCKHLFESDGNPLKDAYEKGRRVYNLFAVLRYKGIEIDATKALDLMLEKHMDGEFFSHAVSPQDKVTLCSSGNESVVLSLYDRNYYKLEQHIDGQITLLEVDGTELVVTT